MPRSAEAIVTAADQVWELNNGTNTRGVSRYCSYSPRARMHKEGKTCIAQCFGSGRARRYWPRSR